MKLTRCSLLVLPALVCATTIPSQANHHGKMGHGKSTAMSSKMNMADARAENARMLIQTLSEEKTEINALAAQQAMFRKLGGEENNRIARLWGVWIREHKAGGPMLMNLIKINGGNPAEAKILKAPVLGEPMKMLHATHMDHMAAVTTSQMRHAKAHYGKMTSGGVIKQAMNKRATLARKHMRQMSPFHNEKNCPMCAAMMKGGNMHKM